MNKKSEEIIATFSFHLGAMTGLIQRVIEDKDAVAFFKKGHVSAFDLKEAESVLRNLVGALYQDHPSNKKKQNVK